MYREASPSPTSMMGWSHQRATEGCRSKLAESLSLRTTYGRRQLIYDEGDPIECWYRIVSGTAQRFTLRVEGKRQIVDLLLPGDFFGFGAHGLHGFAAQTVGDCTVVARYPRARLQALARSDANLAQELQAMALEERHRLQDLILILGRTTAREKIGALLLHLGERVAGHPTDRVVLPISRYDIADYLSVSVETVSRTLTDLKRRRLIAFSGVRHLRILDRAAIEAPICDPCSGVRQI